MGRSPCCEKLGLKKGPWTPEEDQKLLAFIDQHGHGSWGALPAKAGLRRCGKSCRLRWINYLRPDIKRGKFSMQEEQTIIQLHALLGNRWSAMATHLPKRTDNEIKNYWNTHLKKRLTKMGIDPVTHKPFSGTLCATAGLSHMAQWESARLEAEVRLVRQSKLLTANSIHKNKNLQAPPPCLDVLNAWQAQLATLSSSSSCTTKEASAFSIIMGLTGGDSLESPTSTLSFPLSTINFPAKTTTNMVENDMILHEDIDSMTDIQILPLNDMSYCNESGDVAWFASGAGNEDAQDDVVNFAADGFPYFSVSGINNNGTNVAESYGVGTGHHGTRLVGGENKDYWNNILTNLVTANAASSSPPSGTWPSDDVF